MAGNFEQKKFLFAKKIEHLVYSNTYSNGVARRCYASSFISLNASTNARR